jgi:hypothetical protein
MNEYVQPIHTTKSGVVKRPIEYVPTLEEQSEMDARRLQIRAEAEAARLTGWCLDQRGTYRHPRNYKYVGG